MSVAAWLVTNTIVAALLACAVLIFARYGPGRTRPAITHALWVAVLVNLVCPPLIEFGLDTSWLAPGASDRTTTRPVERGAPSRPPTDRGFDLPPSGGRDATDRNRSLSVVLATLEQSIETERSGEIRGDDTLRSETSTGPAVGPDLIAHRLRDAIDHARASSWMFWVGCAWSVGSVLVGLRLALGILQVQRMLSLGTRADRRLRMAVESQASRLGLRPPRIIVTDSVRTPFVWGVGRPTLVWPRQLDVDSRSSRAMLVHELAHLLRCDHWVAWLEAGAAVVFFWHPMQWLVRREMREQAELACDAWALWAEPTARLDYAGALLGALESRRSRCPSTSRSALPALGAGSKAGQTFERRLTMILDSRTSHRLTKWMAAPVMLLAATAVTTVTFAQEKGDPRSDRPTRLEQRIDREIRELVRREARSGDLDDLDRRIEHLVEEILREVHGDEPRSVRGVIIQDPVRTTREEKKDAKDAGDLGSMVRSALGALDPMLRRAASRELREAMDDARDDLREEGLDPALLDEVESFFVGALSGRGSTNIDFEGALGRLVEGALRHAVNDQVPRALAQARRELEEEGLEGIAGGLESVFNELAETFATDEDLGQLGDLVEVEIEGLIETNLNDALSQVRRSLAGLGDGPSNPLLHLARGADGSGGSIATLRRLAESLGRRHDGGDGQDSATGRVDIAEIAEIVDEVGEAVAEALDEVAEVNVQLQAGGFSSDVVAEVVAEVREALGEAMEEIDEIEVEIIEETAESADGESGTGGVSRGGKLAELLRAQLNPRREAGAVEGNETDRRVARLEELLRRQLTRGYAQEDEQDRRRGDGSLAELLRPQLEESGAPKRSLAEAVQALVDEANRTGNYAGLSRKIERLVERRVDREQRSRRR